MHFALDWYDYVRALHLVYNETQLEAHAGQDELADNYLSYSEGKPLRRPHCLHSSPHTPQRRIDRQHGNRRLIHKLDGKSINGGAILRI